MAKKKKENIGKQRGSRGELAPSTTKIGRISKKSASPKKVKKKGFRYVYGKITKYYGHRFKDKEEIRQYSHLLLKRFDESGVTKIDLSLLRKSMKGVKVKTGRVKDISKSVVYPEMPDGFDIPFLYWSADDFSSKVKTFDSRITVYGKTVLLDNELRGGDYHDYSGGYYQDFVGYMNNLLDGLEKEGKITHEQKYVYVRFGGVELVERGKRGIVDKKLLEGEFDRFQVEVYSCDEYGTRVFYGYGEDKELQDKIRDGYKPKIVRGKEKEIEVGKTDEKEVSGSEVSPEVKSTDSERISEAVKLREIDLSIEKERSKQKAMDLLQSGKIDLEMFKKLIG